MRKIIILFSIFYFIISSLVFAQEQDESAFFSPGETSVSAQGNYTGPRAQDESAFFQSGPAQNYTAGCGPQGNGYKLCIPILGVDYIENSLAEYIRTIYRFALGLSGLLVFIMIVWGGIQYTISAGNTTATGDARDRIFQAILGMGLLFLSYIILNTINPDLISLREPNVGDVFLPNIPPATSSQSYDTSEETKLAGERVNTLTDINNTSDEIQTMKDELSTETDSDRQQELQQVINGLEKQKLEQQKEILNNSTRQLDITIQQIESKKANSHWWSMGGSKFDSVDERQLQSLYKQRQYFTDQQKITDSKLNN